MNLTLTETIALIDCVNNRIDDLEDCAAYGDAAEVEPEIEMLSDLLVKLSEGTGV